jgi:hypothetical protein
MYVIHRMVRRTQLYLDDEMARLLTTESRRRGTTMSELVREAVAQQYGRQASDDRSAIIDRLAGIWSDREDLGGTEDMVRRLRRSSRPERWQRGRGGKASPRHRRPR